MRWTHTFIWLEPYRVCRRLSILRECSDDQIKI
ncbi:glycosyltransferase, partial [Acinetobacter baumannii]|nr:glycosyltransferase [Acinetobacter baumannii]